MKPGLLYSFAPEFEAHMRRLLNGWKSPNAQSKVVASWRNDPITSGQISKLRRLGVKDMPSTKGAASDLISKLTK